MSNFTESRNVAGAEDAPAVSARIVELAVALFTALIGAVVMIGSHEQGIGWSDAGPESGYFPFYIGLIMLAASAGTIFLTAIKWRALGGSFAARGPLRYVVSVFVPMCVYGVAIRLLGMYLASLLFIAWFMWRDRSDRRHSPLKIVLVPVVVVVASYLIFERWFKVPLYAGPLVEWLGIGL
jgi:hypothetical protein